MLQIPCTAWLAFRPNYLNEESIQQIVADAHRAFADGLPAAIGTLQTNVEILDVAQAEPPTHLLAELGEESFLVRVGHASFLRVTANASLDDEKIRRQNEREIDDEFMRSICAGQLGDALETVLMLSEIAMPGCLFHLCGATLVDDRGASWIGKKECFSELITANTKGRPWPPLEYLPIEDVTKWAVSVGIFNVDLAVTRLQRVLAAYSHMVGLGIHREGEVLFRAMQGLEAFYCDGIGDLRRQLAEKTVLWLGPWSDNRNVVGQLYDLRSKFIHGSSRLQFWRHHRKVNGEHEAEMEEFSTGSDFAVRLLLSTLQMCCRKGAKDVNWAYDVTYSK